jgi:hypothetical protein
VTLKKAPTRTARKEGKAEASHLQDPKGAKDVLGAQDQDTAVEKTKEATFASEIPK